jgi:hypothetical protein
LSAARWFRKGWHRTNCFKSAALLLCSPAYSCSCSQNCRTEGLRQMALDQVDATGTSTPCIAPWKRGIHLHFTADQPLLVDCNPTSIRIISSGSIDGLPVDEETRTDRDQCRSSAPDDLREPRRQDETRRAADLGHFPDGPSWIDLAEVRVNSTESRFEGYLN